MIYADGCSEHNKYQMKTDLSCRSHLTSNLLDGVKVQTFRGQRIISSRFNKETLKFASVLIRFEEHKKSLKKKISNLPNCTS